MKDWKKKSVFLNVQLQTAENELPLFYIKLMHQSKKNAHSANQYPINTAPDSLSLLIGFLSPKIFNLRSLPPTLSFCAEPNGEVAESIIPGITFVLWNRGDLLRRWVGVWEEHFPPPLIRPHGHLLPREKVFLGFLKQWILQLRASPSCRMTCWK